MYESCEVHLGAGDTFLHVLVFDPEKNLCSVFGQAEIDLDDAGCDFAGLERVFEIGLFQPPYVPLCQAEGGKLITYHCSAKGKGVSGEDDLLLPQIDLPIVENADLALAFEMDVAVVAVDGSFLLRQGDQARGKSFQVLDALIFFAGNAETFVVGKGAADRVFIPVVEEPLFVGSDGIVKPDKNGLHVPGDGGFGDVEGEVGAVEDRVDEAKSTGQQGIGASGGTGDVGEGGAGMRGAGACRDGLGCVGVRRAGLG